MSMNLYDASNQWAERPADERFWGLRDALAASQEYAARCSVSDPLRASSLRAKAIMGAVYVEGEAGVPVQLSHLGFGQLSRLVGFPADPLRTLPATLASQVINHKLANRDESKAADLSLLLYEQNIHLKGIVPNPQYVVSAITTTRYSRIWNYEVIERAMQLQDAKGWKVPPARWNGDEKLVRRPATTSDCLANVGAGGGSLVRPGDEISPAGVYVWQGGMFVLLVDDTKPIDDGTGPLFKGCIIENAETGTGSFRIRTFMLRGVCGNHILWGVEKVTEWSVRHIGEAKTNAWSVVRTKVLQSVDKPASETEGAIKVAKQLVMGSTKEEVLDLLFGQRIGSMKALSAGYDACEQLEPGLNPRSVWGMAQGLTRASQGAAYAEARMDLDAAAGKLLKRVRI